ncbi:hypothetical protein FQN51_001123 [Onygenales sp. PD_10]|nr:hypothetical protein FQN51_001123 [Onygenales sp. PD_10]
MSVRRHRGLLRSIPPLGKGKGSPVPHPVAREVGPGPAAAPVRLADIPDVAEAIDGLRIQIEQLAAAVSNQNH